MAWMDLYRQGKYIMLTLWCSVNGLYGPIAQPKLQCWPYGAATVVWLDLYSQEKYTVLALCCSNIDLAAGTIDKANILYEGVLWNHPLVHTITTLYAQCDNQGTFGAKSNPLYAQCDNQGTFGAKCTLIVTLGIQGSNPLYAQCDNQGTFGYFLYFPINPKNFI